MTTLTAPHRRFSVPTSLTVGGQLVGAAGLIVQWISAPAMFKGFGFPPGLFYVLGAAAIVLLDRRSNWAPAAAIALSLWITIGGLAGGNLLRNLADPRGGVVAGNIVMLAGLAISAVAGLFAIVHNHRTRPEPWVAPLGSHNPRRVPVTLVFAGLLLDAVGDAAPEGFNWDGPGPILFLVLAILVAVLPGNAMIELSMMLSLTFVLTAFMNPESGRRLSTPSDVLPFAGTLTQVVGLALAVLAGVVAILPRRTRSSTPAPR
ncbi:hypothetical protein ACFWY9_34570 [Amycolatopsis sp. NPDC059027]|uniref:hypothetical protein n=1 Tax=unclassified Amycolatopsis TaxID=2618356 RepID=UPI00366B1B45